jgi:hypothetical protein
MDKYKLIFATWIESSEGWPEAFRLTESIRAFGGQWAQAPVWVYLPEETVGEEKALDEKLNSLNISVKFSRTPEAARWLYYSGKVFAAAAAETEAEKAGDLLVWMDYDTIVLDEPTDFVLAPDIDLAFSPVMHNRSGSLYEKPPDDFWSRIYDRLGVTYELLPPMITPADQQKIRAYIHVGLIIVRPEKEILRRWVDDFEALYTDPALADMCRADRTRCVFLHQTAMTGAFKRLRPDGMRELSNRYNYPIFFEKQYGGVTVFDSIEKVVTVRCVVNMKAMGPDWHRQLTGPPDKIDWLREHFQK